MKKIHVPLFTAFCCLLSAPFVSAQSVSLGAPFRMHIFENTCNEHYLGLIATFEHPVNNRLLGSASLGYFESTAAIQPASKPDGWKTARLGLHYRLSANPSGFTVGVESGVYFPKEISVLKETTHSDLYAICLPVQYRFRLRDAPLLLGISCTPGLVFGTDAGAAQQIEAGLQVGWHF